MLYNTILYLFFSLYFILLELVIYKYTNFNSFFLFIIKSILIISYFRSRKQVSL
ncbi:hypothetical protein [Magpiepox virus]|nr:hypothetical protein [Magpiepox virus]